MSGRISSRATLARPWNFVARSSTIGPMSRLCLHQAAQKWTSTGTLLPTTSRSKFSSDRSTTGFNWVSSMLVMVAASIAPPTVSFASPSLKSITTGSRSTPKVRQRRSVLGPTSTVADAKFAAVLLRNPVDDRRELLARDAPAGAESDEHGFLAEEDLGPEIGIRHRHSVGHEASLDFSDHSPVHADRFESPRRIRQPG